MDSSPRILNDLTSPYWWLSVVLVGMAINLASAYLKPPLDNLLARYSSARRIRKQQANEAYEKEVLELVQSPTLLLLEGQKAAHSESLVYLMGITIGVNVILLFTLAQQTTEKTGIVGLAAVLLAILLPILLVLWFAQMQVETRVQSRFKAAMWRVRGKI